MSSREEVFALTADARRRTLAMLERLTTDQWSAPTLCAGWSVGVLAAHLTQPSVVSFPRFVVTALRHGGDTDRSVDALAHRLARRPRDETLELLGRHTDDRVDPRGVGPVGPLADACIHLRDVARPLGLDDDVPDATWTTLLAALVDGAPPAVVPPGRLDGLGLVATDTAWRTGSGAEVRGPAEALVLTVSGRRVALADLEGPGVALLDERTA